MSIDTWKTLQPKALGSYNWDNHCNLVINNQGMGHNNQQIAYTTFVSFVTSYLDANFKFDRSYIHGSGYI